MGAPPPADIILCPNCRNKNYTTNAACYYCGTPLNAYAQQGGLPPPQPYPQKKSSGLAIAGGVGIGVIVGVLLLVLICVGGVLFVVLRLGQAVTEVASLTSANHPAQNLRVGQAGDSAGWRVTVHGVRRDKEGVLPPKEGHEFLVVDATFENTSKESSVFASIINTRVKDSEGRTYGLALGGNTQPISEGAVNAGDKIRGELAYEVPIDARGLTFVYDPVFGGGELRFAFDD